MVCTLLLLLSPLVLLTSVAGQMFYATPALNTSCPDRSVTCMTLSQYVAASSDLFTSDTTLILLPGNHNLDSEMTITNATSFSISSTSIGSSNEDTHINCYEFGRFVFRNVSHVSIERLQVSGCIQNVVESVEQLVVENAVFTGQGRNGTGFKLIRVNTAMIANSLFQSFQGSTQLTENLGEAIVGGAITAKQSSVSLLHSQFINNTASIGGTLCALSDSTLDINNCTFKYNQANGQLINFGVTGLGGVLYANSSNIIVVNSRLTNNRALTGGVTFTTASNVSVEDCVLNENYALNGGVLYADANTNLNIRSSTFKDNLAQNTSTIMEAQFSIVSIENSFFHNNSAILGYASVVSSTLKVSGDTSFVNNFGSFILLSSNCTFSGNTTFVNNFYSPVSSLPATANLGGALTLLQSNVIMSNKMNFSQNTALNAGAMFVILSKVVMFDDIYIANNTAVDSGGGIVSYFSQVMFGGNITIVDNTALRFGGGIHSVGATNELVNGALNIVRNSAKFGGGLNLEQNAKLFVVKEQFEYEIDGLRSHEMNFIQNQAKYGGAIYVLDNSSSSVCPNTVNISAESVSNCFFQTFQTHVNVRRGPIILENIFFINNTATKSGSLLYGGLLDRCTLSTISELVFNGLAKSFSGAYYLSVVSNFDLADTSTISSDPVRVCFCREAKGKMVPDCMMTNTGTAKIRKGGSLNVSVVAVDQVNKPLSARIVAALSSTTADFVGGSDLVSESCTTIAYYNITSPDDSVQLLLHAVGPCSNLGRSQTSLDIEFLPCECGIGLQMVQSTRICRCVCDRVLVDTGYITTCFDDTQSILRESNYWIDYIALTDNQECFVLYPVCPFDYCINDNNVSINLNIPNGADDQCAFNRTGRLCGRCKNGLSLSLGSSNCVECSNYWLLLLIPFTILGLLLVVLILVCNLTVAVGTINGLIFYANVFSLNRSYLTLPKFFDSHFYISWVSLDWGISTCFYNGLDGYAKVWLQYAFPLYLIVLTLSIMVISRFSQGFSKLLSNRNPVATLATLILLLYTKIFRTVYFATTFATLRCINGTKSELVWQFDANQSYLRGRHVPLFIVGLVVGLACLAYTFLLLFGQWIPRLSKWRLLKWTGNLKFASFMDAYYAPYNPKHRYWVGVLCIARVLIFFASGSGTPASLFFIVLITMILVGYKQMCGRIYKNWVVDVLETSFFLNLFLFAGGTIFVTDVGGNQTALAFTSFVVVILTVLGILIYHTYSFVFAKTKFGSRIIDKIHKMYAKSKTMDIRQKIVTGTMRLDASVDAAIDLREPLLEEDAVDQPVQEGIANDSIQVHLEPTCSIVGISDYQTDRNSTANASTVNVSTANASTVTVCTTQQQGNERDQPPTSTSL